MKINIFLPLKLGRRAKVITGYNKKTIKCNSLSEKSLIKGKETPFVNPTKNT